MAPPQIQSAGVIAFDSPAWLFDHVFTVPEIADAFGVSVDTLNNWLTSLAMLGFPLTVKTGKRRLMTGHGAYTVAVLAALHAEAVHCTPKVLVQAHWATHPEGKPRLPYLAERRYLAEENGTAPPAAIEVDLSRIWIDTEPKLTALVAG